MTPYAITLARQQSAVSIIKIIITIIIVGNDVYIIVRTANIGNDMLFYFSI